MKTRLDKDTDDSKDCQTRNITLTICKVVLHAMQRNRYLKLDKQFYIIFQIHVHIENKIAFCSKKLLTPISGLGEW